jgi:hypothetical protein
MSDKSIVERLQVKKERTLAVIGATAALERAIGGSKRRADASTADVVLLFTANRKALTKALPQVLRGTKSDAILWLAYPKLTSVFAADLSRDVIHRLAPEYGLDTVAQIAIDSDWSALRLKRVAGSIR